MVRNMDAIKYVKITDGGHKAIIKTKFGKSYKISLEEFIGPLGRIYSPDPIPDDTKFTPKDKLSLLEIEGNKVATVLTSPEGYDEQRILLFKNGNFYKSDIVNISLNKYLIYNTSKEPAYLFGNVETVGVVGDGAYAEVVAGCLDYWDCDNWMLSRSRIHWLAYFDGNKTLQTRELIHSVGTMYKNALFGVEYPYTDKNGERNLIIFRMDSRGLLEKEIEEKCCLDIIKYKEKVYILNEMRKRLFEVDTESLELTEVMDKKRIEEVIESEEKRRRS